MSTRDEDRYRSAAPAQSSRPAEHELPDGATCRNTPRERKERALLSKRARSSSPSAYRGDAHDRWTRVREDDSRRDNSDRFAPATSPSGNRPIRERKAASASQSPEANRKRRHQSPDEAPLPNRHPAKSAAPIKISSSTDARPTRNARGEVVMVSYDYALLQHRRRGTPLESFDMRQLRHQPALQPRRRWLSIQNYLHPYGARRHGLLSSYPWVSGANDLSAMGEQGSSITICSCQPKSLLALANCARRRSRPLPYRGSLRSQEAAPRSRQNAWLSPLPESSPLTTATTSRQIWPVLRLTLAS